MASVNKVIIMGGLTRDPEIRYAASGDAIANFSLATSERWKDKQGVWQEKTEYHNVVAYRRLAEVMGEYLKKASQVYIEGKLQTRKWEKDGIKRYSTEIVADHMQMLGGKKDNEENTDSSNASNNANASEGFHPASRKQGNFDDFDDDIPFMNPYKFNWRML